MAQSALRRASRVLTAAPIKAKKGVSFHADVPDATKSKARRRSSIKAFVLGAKYSVSDEDAGGAPAHAPSAAPAEEDEDDGITWAQAMHHGHTSIMPACN